MTTNVNIKIPGTKADISPEWVRKVTGQQVLEEDFIVDADIQAGSGFLSSMFRISYNIEGGKRDGIIVKLLPTDEEWLEFALSDASDEREIKFYSTILPDLLEVVPQLLENVCEYYSGTVTEADPATGKAKASMLIMKDLAVKGFKMMNFSGERSDKIVRDLVTFMARLHYGAFAVEQKKGIPLAELYPYMQGLTGEEEWIKQWVPVSLGDGNSNGGYPAVKELLSTHNVSDETYDKYHLLKPHTEVMIRKICENGRRHPCLIHGDAWPPNLQIHDSLPVKVLDWQMLGYRDVAYDLSIMLVTVLPKEQLTRAKLTELVKQYYDEFEELCKEGGLQDKIKRRSWEEFEEFFNTWGMTFAFLVMLPSVFCYKKDLPKYANIFRFYCEEYHLPEFLLKECTKDQ